jgi:hypothetical protein
LPDGLAPFAPLRVGRIADDDACGSEPCELKGCVHLGGMIVVWVIQSRPGGREGQRNDHRQTSTEAPSARRGGGGDARRQPEPGHRRASTSPTIASVA